MSENIIDIQNIKTIFCGYNKVGKSSILQYIINKNYKEPIVSLNGSSYIKKKLTIENKVYNFDLYEICVFRLQILCNYIMKNTKYMIMIFDPFSRFSFNELHVYDSVIETPNMCNISLLFFSQSCSCK